MRQILLYLLLFMISCSAYAGTTEQYTVFELQLKGPSAGNPFKEVQLSAEFSHLNRSLFCEGFYDGDGIYKIRFMPDEQGEWTYNTKSNIPGLDAKKGSFNCVINSGNNHGPVKVRNIYDFGYADGTTLLSSRHNLLCLGAPA